MYYAREDQSHIDLAAKRDGRNSQFFLQNVLKARIECDCETGQHEADQEVNVYVAGLLTNLVSSGQILKEKPYLSPYDCDVRDYLDEHPGARFEFVVYKDNADFGLMSLGVFLGLPHPGSYYGRVLAGRDESSRVALYYRMAASALCHLRGDGLSLVDTFNLMADDIQEVIRILRKVAGDYFGFVEQLSEGSIYHLEREIDAGSRAEEYRRRLDEFLDLYSAYKSDPTPQRKASLLDSVLPLKDLNPRFSFDEASL